MTEERFMQILTQTLASALAEQDGRLGQKLEERLAKNNVEIDKKFAKNNAKLTIDLSKKIDQKLNTELTLFFGQITRYIDKRLGQVQSEYRVGIHQLQIYIDGYIDLLSTDEQERAAMNIAQDRHTSWIKQLSVATSTKLVPEL